MNLVKAIGVPSGKIIALIIEAKIIQNIIYKKYIIIKFRYLEIFPLAI
jgi:hypothetical protein